MPVPTVSLEGACDLHVHAAPDPFDRVGDDVEAAQAAKEASMRAIVLKNAFESTVSRAYHTARQVPGIHVFGGIVLNSPVGGINPAAAEIALKFGAKVVWMPTNYSKEHCDIHGPPGDYAYKSAGLKIKPKPLTIFDDEGKVSEATTEVLRLVADYDAIVSTGHLSRGEIYALVKEARQVGCQKVLISHPHFTPPNLDDQTLSELIAEGAWVELCAGTVLLPTQVPMERVIRTLKTLGAERCIISTDAGNPVKPKHPDTLRAYLYALSTMGISQPEIHLMSRVNPARLLNLEGEGL